MDQRSSARHWARSVTRPALLAIGAHPDDIEIGAFGSLLRWRDAYDMHIVLATRGEQGIAEDNDPGVRVAEAQAAAAIIGADFTELQLPDGYLRDDLRTVQKLEEVIRRARPRRVLVHHTQDVHQDHRHLAFATLSAARDVPEVLLYETPGTLDFRPGWFVDISETVAQKVASVRLHTSQRHRAYTAESQLVGLASVHAARIGRPGCYVEAFQVHRIIEQ